MKSIILTILLCLVCQVTWACGFGSPIAGGMCRGYLTSGTTWTVPSDWNNSSNTIECIGGGAAGDKGNDTPGIGAGGGGGAYSRSVNVVLSGTINYVVGAGGTTDAANGGNTVFNGTTLLNVSATAGCAAEQGYGSAPNGAQVGGSPGLASNGTAVGLGAVKFSGGSAICNTTGNWANTHGPVGAGGGAAGPLGAGGSVTWTEAPVTLQAGGNGGGGNGGGGNGGNTVTNPGANGGNNWSGSGGGPGGSSSATAGTAGTNGGGGGGGGYTAAGSNGGTGTEWDASHGSGGGGGANGDGNGVGTSNPPGNGALYGGGGAGGGDNSYTAFGTGAAGIIVITYFSTASGQGASVGNAAINNAVLN
jgi:hypothetical protein